MLFFLDILKDNATKTTFNLSLYAYKNKERRKKTNIETKAKPTRIKTNNVNTELKKSNRLEKKLK